MVPCWYLDAGQVINSGRLGFCLTQNVFHDVYVGLLAGIFSQVVGLLKQLLDGDFRPNVVFPQ